jgi:hypothetical protein
MQRQLRRIIFILLLVVSLALVLWGFWPGETMIKTLPVSPFDMQIPTPTSWWLALKMLA